MDHRVVLLVVMLGLLLLVMNLMVFACTISLSYVDDYVLSLRVWLCYMNGMIKLCEFGPQSRHHRPITLITNLNENKITQKSLL